MDENQPFDPLDYTTLTASVVRELMTRGPYPLPLPNAFPGPGVYALFYVGHYPPYASIRSPNATLPIYVGKAVPKGARKGVSKMNPQDPALFERIKEHVESIDSVPSLSLEDFVCRYLTVVPVWVSLTERFLVSHYQPVWNSCIEGFGNHDPGKGRHKQKVSWWDTLHPGRHWAQKLTQDRTEQEALEKLKQFVADQNLDSGNRQSLL